MSTVEEIMEELKTLKAEIDDAKQIKAEKTGQLSEQMKTLKTFGVNSVEESKKKIASLKKKHEELEKTILADFKVLKEQYEW
jgi:predicted  nucleic acid-binding Zn-ribbon protein